MQKVPLHSAEHYYLTTAPIEGTRLSIEKCRDSGELPLENHDSLLKKGRFVLQFRGITMDTPVMRDQDAYTYANSSFEIQIHHFEYKIHHF